MYGLLYILYMASILNWINNNIINTTIIKPTNIIPITSNISNNDDNCVQNISCDDCIQNISCDDCDKNEEQHKQLSKWSPNNELVKKYNEFIDKAGSLNGKKRTELQLIKKSKELIKSYKIDSKADDIGSKISALQTKQELLQIDCKLQGIVTFIKEFELDNDDILVKWNIYLEFARNFLINNNLSEFISINDILSSNALYIMMKRNMDGYHVSASKEKYLNMLIQLDTFFDIEKINISLTLKLSQIEIENKRQEIIARMSPNNIITDLSIKCTSLPDAHVDDRIGGSRSIYNTNYNLLMTNANLPVIQFVEPTVTIIDKIINNDDNKNNVDDNKNSNIDDDDKNSNIDGDDINGNIGNGNIDDDYNDINNIIH